MKTRRRLALFFLVGAVVLMVAVFAGNRMGDRVIGQVGQRLELQPTIVPSIGPTEEPRDDDKRVFWKKSQIVTAATDPAFPDPRVTPPPTASPRPVTPTPKPTDFTDNEPSVSARVTASPAPTVLLTPVPAPSQSASNPETIVETPAPLPSR